MNTAAVRDMIWNPSTAHLLRLLHYITSMTTQERFGKYYCPGITLLMREMAEKLVLIVTHCCLRHLYGMNQMEVIQQLFLTEILARNILSKNHICDLTKLWNETYDQLFLNIENENRKNYDEIYSSYENYETGECD
jgi:hypothetical protein